MASATSSPWTRVAASGPWRATIAPRGSEAPPERSSSTSTAAPIPARIPSRPLREAVLDPAERCALDAQRRQAAVAAVDLSAHQGEGLGDAIHGPAANRLVAIERPRPGPLAGEPPRKDPQQSAGVADVDLVVASTPVPSWTAQADTGDAQVDRARLLASGPLHPGAELLHGAIGRPRVPRVEVALDRRGPLPHRTDQRRAVADRLVGRGPQRAAQRPRRVEPRHRETDTLCPRPRTTAAARSASTSPAIQSETAPVRMSGAGCRARSSMLTPARPSARAISATVPGRFSTPRRSS